MSGEVTPGLRALLGRLTTFVVDWHISAGKRALADEPDYEPGIDREEAPLDKANVVSSLVRPTLFDDERRHVLAIDLDIPAHLVGSSTPGHSHLYVEVPGGIPHHRYMALLSALADCKIIERGYAEVSQARGHSDLRLPWVAKGDPAPPMPGKAAAAEVDVLLKSLEDPRPPEFPSPTSMAAPAVEPF